MRSGTEPHALPDKSSIPVLPLQNMSGDDRHFDYDQAAREAGAILEAAAARAGLTPAELARFNELVSRMATATASVPPQRQAELGQGDPPATDDERHLMEIMTELAPLMARLVSGA